MTTTTRRSGRDIGRATMLALLTALPLSCITVPDMDELARRSRLASEPDAAVVAAIAIDVGDRRPYTGDVDYGWMGGFRWSGDGIELTVRHDGPKELEIVAVSETIPHICYQQRIGEAWEYIVIGRCGNAAADYTSVSFHAGSRLRVQVPIPDGEQDFRVGFVLRQFDSDQWTRVWSPAIPGGKPSAPVESTAAP